MARARRFLPILPAAVISTLLTLVAATIVLAGESPIPFPK